MFLNDPFADRKAGPGALIVPLRIRVQLLEHPEDPLLITLLYSDSVVLHEERDHPVLHPVRLTPHADCGEGLVVVLDRVDDQVAEQLADPDLVPLDRGKVSGYLEVNAPERDLEILLDLLEEALGVYPLV